MATEKQGLEAHPGLLNKENRDTKGKALLNKRQSINYKKKRGEKMSEGQKVVSQFHKNSIEIVKLCLSKWKDKEYIDLRIWVMQNPAEPESEIATKKGIRLSVDLLPKLIEGLNETSRILKESESKNRSPEREKQDP
jgi:hypothetical protein